MTTVRTQPQRAGMTFVEVLVAITILGTATLAMGGFFAKFAQTVTETRMRATAVQLATERIEQIKADQPYDSLETRYMEGNASVIGHPGYRRTTMFDQVGGSPIDVVDYQIVTVIVTGPKLTRPIKKTTVISGL